MKRSSPRPSRWIAALLLITTAALVGISGCNAGRPPEPELPPQPCSPGLCPPGQWPTQPPPVETGPTARPPGIMPSFLGLPCNTSEDLICGWGRCIAGRCGGCQTSADCKSGGACGWTPIGMACLYGGSSSPR